VLHLGNPGNVMAAAAHIGSGSPISLELLFLGVCVVVAVVYLVVVNREGTPPKATGVVGIVAGLVLAYVLGHGYEVVAARPVWATPALGLSYLLSGLTLGGLAVLSVSAALKDDDAAVKKLALIVAVAAVLEAVAFAVFGAGATGAMAGNEALFWGGAFVVGGLAAAACAAAVYAKPGLAALAYVGLLAAVIGGVCFRLFMWLTGTSDIPNLFDLAADTRGLFPL